MKIPQDKIIRHTELESSYIPIALRRAILEKYDHTCYFCGKKGIKYLCHDIPKCRGGKTKLSNLLGCCTPCRREKDQLTTVEYTEYLRHTVLKEKDVFKEMKMFVKVYFLDGEIIEGKISSLPEKQDNGFYLHTTGDGGLTWVSVRAIKKFEVKGGKKNDE